jgi:hypothetical protein
VARTLPRVRRQRLGFAGRPRLAAACAAESRRCSAPLLGSAPLARGAALIAARCKALLRVSSCRRARGARGARLGSAPVGRAVAPPASPVNR